jgi:translation initiation factor IF-1
MTDSEATSNQRAAGTAAVPARLKATVIANLANGMLRLRLPDAREVEAHAAQDLRMALTRLLPGDPVLAELSPFDPGRARVLELLKAGN